MKNILYSLVVLILVFAAGFYTAKKLSPTIKTETVEKVVEKEVVKKDVQVITKYYDKDGKIKKEVVKDDKSVVSKDKKSDKKESTVVKLPDNKPQWHVSLSSDRIPKSFDDGTLKLRVERRILGPLFLGGGVSNKNDYHFSVGAEF